VLMCDIPRLICLGILRPGAKCSWPVKTPKPGFGNDSSQLITSTNVF